MPINKQRTKIEMREDGPFQQEGFDLMAAVFAVHNEIGGGLAEEVYQESLEIELSLHNIPFMAKRPLTTFYKGHALKRCYVPDFCVHDGIIVELKAVSQLLPEHEAQLFNYMRLTDKRVGYLINLAPLKRAEWRRYVL